MGTTAFMLPVLGSHTRIVDRRLRHLSLSVDARR
jgi:hypothetical protein